MRVTGGRFGGRKLIAPPGRSLDVRPTSDRARETLFALLGNISDRSVLDIFCGTGALAIEALSRDADSAVLVDRSLAIAKRNVEALGLAKRTELVRGDAIRHCERAVERGERYGVILCDPPYKLAEEIESALAAHLPKLLPPRFGRVAIESAARRPLEVGLPIVAERRIGEALIRIHER